MNRKLIKNKKMIMTYHQSNIINRFNRIRADQFRPMIHYVPLPGSPLFWAKLRNGLRSPTRGLRIHLDELRTPMKNSAVDSRLSSSAAKPGGPSSQIDRTRGPSPESHDHKPPVSGVVSALGKDKDRQSWMPLDAVEKYETQQLRIKF